MNDYKRPTLWNSIPPVVKNLIIINLILWLATEMFLRTKGLNLNDVLGMHYWASDKFNFYQIVTYMFMHSGFYHFFFNMFAVFMFGSLVERTWGSQRFLLYYLLTGIGAGIVQQVVWAIEFQPLLNAFDNAISQGSVDSLLPYQQELSKYFRNLNLETLNISAIQSIRTEFTINLVDKLVTVGASGAVFGLLLAYGVMFPNSEVFIMFIPIPIKAKYFVVIYGVIELFLGVSGRMDGIAHFAHLGGMLFGFILIFCWKKKGRAHY